MLEYFFHGALCVAFSGQRYISHAHTGRSANRGECSQACRLLVASRVLVCPRCAKRAHSTFVREGRQHWQCQACRHRMTITSGTIFEATKLPLTRRFLAMHLLTQTKDNV